MGAVTPPVLHLLLSIITALLLPKVASSCNDIPECHTIIVQVSASEISVTGLAEGFFLKNITVINENVISTFDASLNSTSLKNPVSGTQYVIHYGNSTIGCCRDVTTKPLSVKSLQIGNVASYSVSLTWSNPNDYKTSYSYRVQINVTSSSTTMNNEVVTSESATIMNLTPGETYTFMVYTRAGDNLTESDPVSESACTVPEQVSSITVNKSADFLGVSWKSPEGKVDNYNVSLTGAINNRTQTNTTQVAFSGLLPGREYNVYIQTISGNCSRTSDPVTEATYPTQPGKLSFNNNAARILTLSWLEPVNMTDANMSYNISYGIFPATNLTVESNTTNIVLENLTSGTNYTITVVTVGVRGYQSLPSSASVYTKPMSVKSLQISNFTTNSVGLTWSQPDEYQTSYSYRVQTSNSSSAITLNDTIVMSESATIMGLTPGETYTFTVYTRAGDDLMESDPVSESTCTVPGRASISLNNYRSVDFLEATWTKPEGRVDKYTVSLTGTINHGIDPNTTQVNITGLLPGREYNVTVQISSGNCSWTSDPVTDATYPTQPGKVFLNTTATEDLTLSWLEPVNMTNVKKSYNIRYGISPLTELSVESNTTNVTLQGLISGTNYAITVVTVGVRGYQSLPVNTSVYTKPMSVKSLQITNFTTDSVELIWSQPDEYKTSYSYRVQTSNSSSAITMNDTIVTSESATIMGLTPGETYTFMVYTRAGDNLTESDVALLTDCIAPEQVVGIQLTNNNSTDTLEATWRRPETRVDNYRISLTGAANISTETNTTQVNFTELLPGREYNVIIHTISGNCNQTSAAVTEATCPAPPRHLSVITIWTNGLTLSWLEPVNMSSVMKSYNISYGNTSGTWTVTSSTTNITLQNLTSGTKYSITVVTVGVRGYQSLPVSISVYTKPKSINSLQVSNVTSYSASLTWNKPDEYQTTYSYKVQTSNRSSTTLINDTIVSRETATIMNLIPGETYTFMVYTRAEDNLTESDPVSYITCTAPEKAVGIMVTNNNSTDTLVATWTKPEGKVDNYNVSLTGAINITTQTNTTQVAFSGLLPGREYNVYIQTISGNCSRTSDPVTEATYPAPPRKLTFNTIGTINVILSWLEPVNMSGVMKSYLISYGNSSGTWTTKSNTTNIDLQNLTSGTNYSINVVTVGISRYQSSPVNASVYTEPFPVNSLQFSAITCYSASLTWSKPNEYKPSYSYRVQTNVTSLSIMERNAIVTNELATIIGLTPGETYTFLVYTRADDNFTESDSVSVSTCTVPEAAREFSCNCSKNSSSLQFTWDNPGGLYTRFRFSATNIISVHSDVNTIMCDSVLQSCVMQGLSFSTIYSVNMTTLSSCGKSSMVVHKQCSTCIGAPPDSVAVMVNVRPLTHYSFEYTFKEFDATNGPIKAHAIIVSRVKGPPPSADDLLKTYNVFKSKSADTYVAIIKYLDKTSQRSSPAETQTVTIGDNSEESPYYKNGPLEPATSYWVAVAGITSLELGQDGMILPSKSLFSFAPYNGPFKTTQNVGMITGAAIGSILGVLVIILIGFFIWRKRRKGEKKADVSLPPIKISQAMSTSGFNSHFAKLKADSNLGFSEEYEKLAPVGTEQTKSAAELPENRTKNRYTNVLPYDVSRVVLSNPRNITEDYINANYIPGYNSPKEFIAAQGPLPKTVNDFWRMIWEKDVQVLVMLTKCAELGKVKCEEYWPQSGTKTYGNLSISMTDEDILSDWTIRDFTLVHMQTRQSKLVRQFHFTAWPDFGVPKTTSDLIRFRNLVHEYTANCYPLNSPMVVHCSAGVGRTGTFITLDRIIKQIEAEDRVDVYGTVYDLRMHRLLMVQTESQYIFLNQCVLDIIKAQKETKPDLIYQNVGVIYQNINNPPLKRTNL